VKKLIIAGAAGLLIAVTGCASAHSDAKPSTPKGCAQLGTQIVNLDNDANTTASNQQAAADLVKATQLTAVAEGMGCK
jgi:outer membrane murein-binding lipoprotein Lpp